MCWHDDNDNTDPMADLRVTSVVGRDKPSEARQTDFWNQAQEYADTSPFQAQYGGPSAMPGLGAMSQRGQQYLTNQILGPGAYSQGYSKSDPRTQDPDFVGQNLGFTQYQAPQEGYDYGQRWPSPDWAYDPRIEAVPTARTATRRTGVVRGGGGDIENTGIRDPFDALLPKGGTTGPIIGGLSGVPGVPGGMQVSAAGSKTAPPWATVADASGYRSAPGGLLGTRAQEETSRAPGPTRVGPNDPGWEAFLAAEDARSPGRGAALRGEGEQYPHWMWDLPAEQQIPGRPYSQGVGLREMEEAGDVTRRMLRQTGPGTPGYDRFLAGELDPITGTRGPGGWQEQAQAGIGETPGFERDAAGNLVPREGFGFSGAELGGVARTPILDAAGNPTGEFYDAPGYRPSYDAIRGGVTGVGAAATRAAPFGVAGQDPFTVQETRVGPNDPDAWTAFLSTKDKDNRDALEAEAAAHPDWTWPVASDVPAVDRGLISGQTGYGVQGTGQRIARDAAGNPLKNLDGSVMMEPVPLAMTEAQRELSQIGRTARPGEAVDELTGDRISAAALEKIGFGTGDADLTTIADQTGYGTAGIPQRAVLDVRGDQVFDPDTGEPIMESALGISAEERALSQIGQAVGPQQVFDPVTGDVRSAAERITGPDISPIGQFRDPDTNLVTDVMTPGAVTDPTLTAPTTKPVLDADGNPRFNIDGTPMMESARVAYTDLSKTAFNVGAPAGLWGEAGFTGVGGEKTLDVSAVAPTKIGGPSGVTVNPLTGQTTQAVGDVAPREIGDPQGVGVDPFTAATTQAIGGVDPTAFGGMSFLGSDLDPYMNQLGIESQVQAAQLDYERAQNEEQARRAASHAWGTRGDIPRAEQEQQMLARIADIRRQGFTDAADRLERDLERQQAAGMQSQQLGVQTGLAGQQLEAQRRESDAARAQQAQMQGQQLGFQGQMQTQQLAQAGGIRGAELGLQAAMQGQQLEAQRRSEDAARKQQAALAGQQLGTQAQMQTQQLTQAGGIRGSELGLQAQMQGQQLQAQRRESDAARAQQAALAGQQLEVQAGMQTQQVDLQAGIQTAQNQLAAAQANQQASIQTGSETQRLDAQRQVDQAQMRLAAQQQTQALGFEGGMQAQQLGTQANIRQAELDMEAARANQATAMTSGSQTQQIQASRQMRQAELNLQRQQQTQALGLEAGMQQAGFGQQTAVRQAELEMEGARANQATALTSGSQTQQVEASRRMRQAELNLQRQQQTQQLGLEAGMQQAGFGQQAAVRQTELDLQRQQATQGLGAEAMMQQRQLGQQAAIASASNALAAAQSDQQAALASGNQAAALEAQRRAQGAQAQIDVAAQTQRLGAGAAGQQAQQEAMRRQRLAEMGLQAGGMGMDAGAQFRQQQMAGAQQLADIGGMRQGATFGAAGQLGQMGAAQEQAQRMQQAYAYEQWLRGIEGGAEQMAMLQSMQPGGQQWGYERKPSLAGQIFGGINQLVGTGAKAYAASTMSDVRMKENIELVGSDNGFNLYEFNYLNQPTRWRGVMAHEVMEARPDAVENRNGLYWVNYDALGMRMEAV